MCKAEWCGWVCKAKRSSGLAERRGLAGQSGGLAGQSGGLAGQSGGLVEQERQWSFVEQQSFWVFPLQLCANILRANPNFHNHPCYDHALVKVGENKAIFIQLLTIFDLQYIDHRIPMVLVLPLDEPRAMEHQGHHSQLRLKRLCPRAHKNVVLIDTNTII